MPRTIAVPVQWLNGKSLDKVHAEMRAYLLRDDHPVCTLEDSMSALGYFDVFGRETILRSFRPTLKEGGENYDLTQNKRWLRTREKWADGTVDRGRSTLSFAPVTQPTRQTRELIEQADGSVSESTREASLRIMGYIENKAGRKLDKTSVQFIAEDMQEIVADNRHLTEAIATHQHYRTMIERQMAVIENLVATVTGKSLDNMPTTSSSSD